MRWLILGALLSSCFQPASAGAANGDAMPEPGVLGFALTDMRWAVYQSPDGKAECPQGLNETGPRPQFDELYPKAHTTGQASVTDTQLALEGLQWFPTSVHDPTTTLRQISSSTGPGWNLDGRVVPADFTAPNGTQGVDNQLYRAIGCIEEFRGPTGIFYNLVNRFIRDFVFNRVLIEIRGVHALSDADSVDVTIYRGLDRLLVDGTGQAITPGGSQRVDLRWGRRYIQHLHGRIEHGVLLTEPADITLPHSIYESTPGEEYVRGGQFRLRISRTGAEGLLVGYADIRRWYDHIMQSWYGQFSYPLLWATLQQRADGYPDPATSTKTAISEVLEVKFTQVFILDTPSNSIAGATR